MFSLGTMSTRGNTTKVSLIEENLINYILANPEEIPKNYPKFGLFKYEPQDQFCRWVDVKKIELKKE